MHFLSSPLALAAVGLATLASASPVSPFSHPRQADSQSFYPRQVSNNGSTPCAVVASAIRATPSTSPTVPAKMAYDCLNTVPLNKSSALKLIEGIRPYVNWQSTLSYLKNPPAEYVEKVQDAVDVLAGLDEIAERVSDDKYKSEYQFGVALYTLFQSTHDGHFVYVPDIVGDIFAWQRPAVLVSVSDDGRQIPQVYGYQDIVALHFGNNTYAPSAITKIDDVDVEEWLEDFSQNGSLQDRDALYNNVFRNLAQVSLGGLGSGNGAFSGGGRGRFVYPGATTKLTFDNGSETTFVNQARVIAQSWTDIASGEDVAKKWIYYGSSAASTADVATAGASPGGVRVRIHPNFSPTAIKRQSASVQAALPGYPSAVVETSYVISGYYLEGEGFEDIAVLRVPSFVSTGALELPFQNASDFFLRKAHADGKKKLIIDLQANGGGTILQGYDLFKKLFPSVLPYGANRYRAHDALYQIGKAYSTFAEGKPRVYTGNYTELDIVSSYFNYGSDADENYKPWQSWDAKFGPHEFDGDEYTSLNRWNLSDPLTPYNSGGINITGYNNRQNWTQQYFTADNIVMVTDGYCASTCTIFSELMKQQGGVGIIALGGRANTDQIQAVGGVKGTNNLPFAYVRQTVLDAQLLNPKDFRVDDYTSLIPFNRASGSAGLNVRDGIRQGDEKQIPLQFVYEPADCRIFYTPEMTIDVTYIWKAVADSRWNGNSRCVAPETEPAPYGVTFGKRQSKSLTPRKPFKARDGISWEQLIDSMDITTDVHGMDFDISGFMMP